MRGIDHGCSCQPGSMKRALMGKVFGVSSGCSWWTRGWRGSADVLRSCESLNDEHRCAAVPAHEAGSRVTVIGTGIGEVSGRRGHWLMQKLTSDGDVSLAVGVSE